MELTAEDFNAHLAEIGAPVQWLKAMECPCRTPRSGGTDTDCPVCEGLRFVWEAPIDTIIGVQGLTAMQQWSKMVEWDKGDMIATIPSDSPAYASGEFDRFVMAEAEFRFNTVLTKSVKDYVKHVAIKRIDRVMAIVNDQPQEFLEWDHFEVTTTAPGVNSNSLTWHPETLLPDGTQYSLRYYASPEYYVYGALVQDRPQFSQDLPRKGILRVMDLFGQAVRP